MIALYVRVSTQEQATKGYSIGEQIERLQNYCLAIEGKKGKVYSDAGYSGANTDRPALKELIADIEAGKVKKVIVYKLDRLSRSQLDTLYLIERVFIANDVDFISITENFDTSTPFGRAMIGLLSVFAQLEREKIKERTSMGIFARAKQGKWKGGTPPFGYDYIDGNLVENEYYSMQVRELFDLFCDGVPLKTIERLFESKGYCSPRGNILSTKQMRRILANRTYIGLVSYKGEQYKGIHSPIIDVDKFNRAQELLSNREKAFGGYKEQSTLLGGLVWCGRCGARYGKYKTGNKKSGIYYNYGCYSIHKKNKSMVVNPDCKNKHYRVDELDNLILNEIRKLKIDSNLFEEIVPESDTADKTDILKKEIADIDNKISRLMDLYAMGRIEIADIDAKVIPLEDKRAKLRDLVAQNEKKSLLSKDDAKILIDSFDVLIEESNFEEKREIISALINKIVIDGEDIIIYWDFV